MQADLFQISLLKKNENQDTFFKFLIIV
jgi:hypothetical protein